MRHLEILPEPGVHLEQVGIVPRKNAHSFGVLPSEVLAEHILRHVRAATLIEVGGRPEQGTEDPAMHRSSD